MIKWILFDQGGVQTYSTFSRKNIFSINDKDFPAKTLAKIFNIPEYKDYLIGKTDENHIIDAFIKETKLNITKEEYIALFKQGVEPIDEMGDILSQLKKHYKIGALINEGIELAEYKFEISKFRKYFDKIIISGNIGCAKPHKAFFLKALDITHAKPEECIFIDDVKANCESASALGIKSVLFHNTKQLTDELKKLGIKTE